MKLITISLNEQNYDLIVKALRTSIDHADASGNYEDVDAFTALYYNLECGLLDVEDQTVLTL